MEPSGGVKGLLQQMQKAKISDESEGTLGPIKSEPKFEFENELPPYQLSEFDKVAELGSGTFGSVALYKHRATGTPVVIKSVDKVRTFAMRQQKCVLQEKLALMELTRSDCPFVVKAYGTTQDADNLYFITEFVPGGEVYTFVKEYSCLTEDQARFYVAQLLVALQHMHEHHCIVYRDIKPENVLLDRDGYCKLVDFGFAKKLERTRKGSDLAKTFSVVGTPEYMAPELSKSGYAAGVDLWAIGIFTYELLTARVPFRGMDEEQTKTKIQEADIDFPDSFSPEVKDFIARLLDKDPDSRLGCGGRGFLEVLEHPWFKDMDWEALLDKTISAPFVPHVDQPFDSSNYEVIPRTGYIRRVSIAPDLMNRFFGEFDCRIAEIPQSPEGPSINDPVSAVTLRSLSALPIKDNFQFDEWPADGELY